MQTMSVTVTVRPRRLPRLFNDDDDGAAAMEEEPMGGLGVVVVTQ